MNFVHASLLQMWVQEQGELVAHGHSCANNKMRACEIWTTFSDVCALHKRYSGAVHKCQRGRGVDRIAFEVDLDPIIWGGIHFCFLQKTLFFWFEEFFCLSSVVCVVWLRVCCVCVCGCVAVCGVTKPTVKKNCFDFLKFFYHLLSAGA